MALVWLPVLLLLYFSQMPAWLVILFAIVALWSVVRAYRQVWLWSQDQRHQDKHQHHVRA
ncbi:hypothetical protein [Kineococcus auxinigenes]|uniref:hypothetical protein n=1 Tax=unclassified Kineococcus TaxID=2621656 RepID=UPI003D7DD198